MRTIEDEIDLRIQQRKRYFENPNYRKLSDYLDINDSEYGELSDCYLFYRYVAGCRFTELTKDNVERAMNPDTNQTIDFEAVYAYFDERLNDKNNAAQSEIRFTPLPFVGDTVKEILDAYRDVVLKPPYDVV
jgi:hypothetical protein